MRKKGWTNWATSRTMSFSTARYKDVDPLEPSLLGLVLLNKYECSVYPQGSKKEEGSFFLESSGCRKRNNISHPSVWTWEKVAKWKNDSKLRESGKVLPSSRKLVSSSNYYYRTFTNSAKKREKSNLPALWGKIEESIEGRFFWSRLGLSGRSELSHQACQGARWQPREVCTVLPAKTRAPGSWLCQPGWLKSIQWSGVKKRSD